MRACARFTWAAVVVFLLGWAAGLPQPVSATPASPMQVITEANRDSVASINQLPYRLILNSSCKTKYGRWVLDPGDEEWRSTGPTRELKPRSDLQRAQEEMLRELFDSSPGATDE